MIEGKKIILGVTGSIAAYKACHIARALVKRGAEVQVVMTPSAKEFVAPLTFSTLTNKPVVSDFFSSGDGTWHSHVALGLWADTMVVAPCTASTLAKMATGVADNMLVTTYLAMKAPVFVAPAMDLDMFSHPATQSNLKTLADRGVRIIDAGSGFLASGLEGKGRMAEPDNIVATIDSFFSAESTASLPASKLHGKRVMVTAGPTYEKIDPVRFIGNYSSGKMGFAIAEECSRRGASVTLIAGPVGLQCSDKIRRIDVESCAEMHKAATEQFAHSDIAILAAAVADFHPEAVSSSKIKRKNSDMTLHLVATSDIAAALGQQKRDGQAIVAFALETDNEMDNARQKMKSKRADMIVLNSLRNPGTCFSSDDNQISILTGESVESFGKKPKAMVAADIINAVERII